MNYLFRLQDTKSFHFNLFIAYALPLCLAVIVTALKITCFRQLGYSILFLLYLLTVFASGVTGGWRASVMAIMGVTACALLWLIPVMGRHYTYPEVGIILVEGIAIAVLFRMNEHYLRGLTDSEKRYRSFIDQSAEALLMCDRNGCITYVSAAATRLLEKEREALYGQELIQLVHPAERQQFDLAWLHLQPRQGSSALVRQRMLVGEDNERWTESCINNLADDKDVAAVIINMRDITHRINQERHQEDFVHMASHELKTPIAAIRGFVQIAARRDKEGKTDKHSEYLDRIGAQTEKLLQQVDDMMNVTKAEVGELAFHFATTDLSDCVREAAGSIQAANAGRTVEVQIQPNLPLVNAGAERIGQVITNLLSNAIKYSPAGAPVTISIRTINNYLEVYRA